MTSFVGLSNCQIKYAFYTSILFSFVRPCQALLSLGASPDYKDRCGLTPLYHTVLAGGDTSCCETLLYYRARLGTRDENGWDESHQVPIDSSLCRIITTSLVYWSVCSFPCGFLSYFYVEIWCLSLLSCEIKPMHQHFPVLSLCLM